MLSASSRKAAWCEKADLRKYACDGLTFEYYVKEKAGQAYEDGQKVGREEVLEL